MSDTTSEPTTTEPVLERIAKMEAVENFEGDLHGTPMDRAPVFENHRRFARAILRAVADAVEEEADKGWPYMLYEKALGDVAEFLREQAAEEGA